MCGGGGEEREREKEEEEERRRKRKEEEEKGGRRNEEENNARNTKRKNTYTAHNRAQNARRERAESRERTENPQHTTRRTKNTKNTKNQEPKKNQKAKKRAFAKCENTIQKPKTRRSSRRDATYTRHVYIYTISDEGEKKKNSSTVRGSSSKFEESLKSQVTKKRMSQSLSIYIM